MAKRTVANAIGKAKQLKLTKPYKTPKVPELLRTRVPASSRSRRSGGSGSKGY